MMKDLSTSVINSLNVAFNTISGPSTGREVTTDKSAMKLGLDLRCSRIAMLDFDGTIVREPATEAQVKQDLSASRWPEKVTQFRTQYATQVVVSTGRSCAEGAKIGEQLHRDSDQPWLVICENGGAAVVCDAHRNLTKVILDEHFVLAKATLVAELQELFKGAILCSQTIHENRLCPNQQAKFVEVSERLGVQPEALAAAADRYASMYFLSPTLGEWEKVQSVANSLGLWATADMPNLDIPLIWGSKTEKSLAAEALVEVVNGRLCGLFAAGNSLSNDAGMLSFVNQKGGQTFFVGSKNTPPNFAQALTSPSELPQALEQALLKAA